MRGRDAIAAWQRLTFGWMGRSPDYKAAFLATYGPNADYYTPFEENARRWYKESQEKVIFHNHTLVNPPVDRNREIHEVEDIFIHAVKETDAGVVVRGAKMVATGSCVLELQLRLVPRLGCRSRRRSTRSPSSPRWTCRA